MNTPDWRSLERAILRPDAPSEPFRSAVRARKLRQVILEGLAEDGLGLSERELLLLRYRPFEAEGRRRSGLVALRFQEAVMGAGGDDPRSTEGLALSTSFRQGAPLEPRKVADDDFAALLASVDATLARSAVDPTTRPLSVAARLAFDALDAPATVEQLIRELDGELAASVRTGDLRAAVLGWGRFVSGLEAGLEERAETRAMTDHGQGRPSAGRPAPVVLLRRLLRPGARAVARMLLRGDVDLPPVGRGASQAYRDGQWDSWVCAAWNDAYDRYRSSAVRFERFAARADRALGYRRYMALPFLERPALSGSDLATRVDRTTRAVQHAIKALEGARLIEPYPRDASWRVWIAQDLVQFG